MSEERRSEGSGSAAAIVVILVVCALLGLIVVGGGAVLAFVRMNGARDEARLMEARAQAEMMAAQMQVQRAEQAAKEAAQATPVAADPKPQTTEMVLEITAAGEYKLAGKPMEYYDDLKAALLEAHFEKGAELQVVISADKETKFNHVSKAVEAAECAGITKHRILTPTSPPPTVANPR